MHWWPPGQSRCGCANCTLAGWASAAVSAPTLARGIAPASPCSRLTCCARASPGLLIWERNGGWRIPLVAAGGCGPDGPGGP